MTQFHLTLVEDDTANEWESLVATVIGDTTTLAVVCRKCAPHSRNEVAVADIENTENTEAQLYKPFSVDQTSL
jgi:hypothetical protein